MKQETGINSDQVIGQHEGSKSMGVLMLLIGAIFLLATSGVTFGGYSPSMLIALAPIYLIGVSAYRRYQKDGRLTRHVMGIAVFALLPITFMAAMALGYSISGLWPLGIIVVGVSFLLFGGGK